MSYPVWPAGLTQFERSGWQSQRQDARRRRQGEAGPPAWRRRFSSVSTVIGVSLVTDRNGKAVFDRFYEQGTAYGSVLFWMPDPVTDGWALNSSTGAPLLTGAGAPLVMAALRLCSFGDEPPVETMIGDVGFRFAFSVVVMP